jgi:DNA adenine methylase
LTQQRHDLFRTVSLLHLESFPALRAGRILSYSLDQVSGRAPAARFLYLNRTCWAGIYRLNRQGHFNVPFGKSGRALGFQDNIADVARMFGKATVCACDFEESISLSGPGDVVYADPPYTTKGENNGFVRYNERLFSWRDQVRLSECCRAAKRRGVFVGVSGLCHSDLLSLYRGWWMLRIARKSLVSRKTAGRGEIHEVVLLSRRPSLALFDNLCRIE